MNAGLLNMLHDPADINILAVAECVDVELDGVIQKFVDEDRMLGRNARCSGDVVGQHGLVINHFHRAAAQARSSAEPSPDR